MAVKLEKGFFFQNCGFICYKLPVCNLYLCVDTISLLDYQMETSIMCFK